jgi:predicted metal-dependent peptidase
MAIQAKPHFDNVAPEMADSETFAAAMLTLRGLARMIWSYMLKHTLIWTYQIPTGATDGVYIYINPNFFNSLPNDSQRAFLLGHEVLHIVLRHAWRRIAFQKAGYFAMDTKLGEIPFIHKIWNWVTDAIINRELIAYGLEPIDGAILDDRFDRNTLADDAYRIKWQEDKAEEEQATADESESDDSGHDPQTDGNADNGSDDNDGDDNQQSANGSDHDGHDTHLDPIYEGTPEEIDEAEREAESKAARQLQEAIAEQQQAVERGEHQDVGTGSDIHGQVTAGENRHTAEVSWREELADVFRMSGNGGEITYSKMHRRRYSVMGVVTPATVGRLSHVTLIGDISASVKRDPFKATLNEMSVMIDELEPTDGVSVLFTNTEVEEHHDVHSGGELTDLDIPMGGGTWLCSALDYMEEQSITSDVTLAFTDCYIDREDMDRLVENDVIIVLDHNPERWMREELEEAGARYIVAVDELLAA